MGLTRDLNSFLLAGLLFSMVVLQRVYLERFILERKDSLDRRLRSRHRREIRQPQFQRGAPNRKRILGAVRVGSVDDHRDPPFFHRIDYMRAAVEHLVDAFALEAQFSNMVRCAARRDQLESHPNQPVRDRIEIPLVFVADADKHQPGVWQIRRSRQLGLGKRHREGLVDSHHLAGRFHLGAEDRIDARKSSERKHRLLDGNMLWYVFGRESDLAQFLPRHHERRVFRQRNANSFAHKWNGARRPWIHFQDKNFAAIDRVLNINQPDHAELAREHFRLPDQFLLQCGAQRRRRQRARTVPRMYPGMLDVLHNSADHYDLAVRDRVYVALNRPLQVTIDQQRVALGGLQSLRHVSAQLFFIWNHFHRASAQDIRRPNKHRVSNLRGARDRVVKTAREHSLGLPELELRDHRIESLAILGAIYRIRRRTQNRDARARKRHRELQGSLPA